MKLEISVKKQNGLSLIELLVSMVIALIVLAGVVNAVIASKQSYLFDEQVAYIQENSRFALDILAKDLREAGYMGGCNINGANVAITANVANPTGAYVAEREFIKTLPVEGFEGGVDAFPQRFATDVRANTDAFILRRAESDTSYIVTNHNAGTSTISVAPNQNFDLGTILLITNSLCSRIGIFSLTGPTTGSSSFLQHGSGGGATENCTGSLDANPALTDAYDNEVACGTAGSFLPTTFENGSSIYRYVAKAFYVAESSFDSNTFSLYSVELGNGGAFRTDELVSSVEDFQISYGVDNDATQDGKANRYMQANQISLDEATSAPYEGWNRVVSIRVQLVMRSRDPVLTQNNSVTLLGNVYNDRHMRQVISATFQLRNVALPGNGV